MAKNKITVVKGANFIQIRQFTQLVLYLVAFGYSVVLEPTGLVRDSCVFGSLSRTLDRRVGRKTNFFFN